MSALGRPCLEVPRVWTEGLEGPAAAGFEARLPLALRRCRWFAGKARTILGVRIEDVIPVQEAGVGEPLGVLALVEVGYEQGEPETYVLPLACAAGSEAEQMRWSAAGGMMVEVAVGGAAPGVVYDALENARFDRGLLEWILGEREGVGRRGKARGWATPRGRALRGEAAGLAGIPSRAEQSNSSVRYGERMLLKLFRRAQRGIHPEVEMGRFLSGRGFPQVPPLLGGLEYEGVGGDRRSLAVVSGFIPRARNAWEAALDAVGECFDGLSGRGIEGERWRRLGAAGWGSRGAEIGDGGREAVGAYLEHARLLGQRTGELHVMLASELDDPAWAPEWDTPDEGKGMAQALSDRVAGNLRLLRRQLPSLPAGVVGLAERVMGLEGEILRRFGPGLSRTFEGWRIRVHGDYHLGQLLWTGADFVILDFEGEPGAPLEERRRKRSPLSDVAGMLRSFHYAAFAGGARWAVRRRVGADSEGEWEGWAQLWANRVSEGFLAGYREAMAGSELLPRAEADLQEQLAAHVLDKALYEVAYELNNRPDWLGIPLRGILDGMEVER